MGEVGILTSREFDIRARKFTGKQKGHCVITMG
jgi:hypothetical protein